MVSSAAPRRAGRYASVPYRWLDVVTMAYMAASGMLLVLLGFGRESWGGGLLLHAAYVVFGLEIVRAHHRRPDSALLRELRTFYPAFIIAYGFFDVSRLQGLISHDDFWATDELANLDHLLFGTHPTLWIQRFHRPWLNEVFCFFNLSYYVIGLGFVLPLLRSGRREEVWAGISIVLFTYVVNYALFLLFPAVGPRMIPDIEALRTPTIDGGFFVWLERMLQGEHGAVRGNAFPSAHVSGAVAWTLVAWRYQRRLAWFLAPLALGTAVSTVYLGFHHAIDPIAGLLVAFACHALGVRILRARHEDPLSQPASRPAAAKTASPR